MIIAPIILLRFLICPATVFWRVGTIYIDSIKRAFRRGFSHIGKEGFERIFPPFTNGNSASSVMTESFFVRVVASGFHTTPGTVFFFEAHSMSPFGFTGSFFVETSAALGIAAAEVAGEYQGCVSTITLTKPSSLFSSFWSRMNDG